MKRTQGRTTILPAHNEPFSNRSVLPQNPPENAIVLVRATLNRWSGEGEIEVFEENIRRAADLTEEEPEVHGIDY